MKIRPVFKHFGTKWSGAKHYPPPLEGMPILEPYAGSAGYSLNYCDYEVIIWEDDWHLHSLWNWLINEATQELILQIPINLTEGEDIREVMPELCFGQQLLVKHWQRTNNVGNCWTVSGWSNSSGQWTANTRSRVAEEVQAIKHWKLERVWPATLRGGTYFIDPPYQFNYQYRSADKFSYSRLVHDMKAIPPGSRIIACEATCPKTGAVPDYLPFVPSHRQVTSRRKATQSHHSQELIYTKDT